MTNKQKSECKRLATETWMSAAEIAMRVGCNARTAAKYIEVFRAQFPKQIRKARTTR